MINFALGKETTLAKPITLGGIAVHSGKPARIRLYQAEAGRGIVFLRSDERGRDVEIPARWDHVVSTELCTVIGANGLTVSTVEHLMAALRAAGIDNLVVEIDGPEMPILDGSAEIFMDAIADAGLLSLKAPRKMIRILKRVRVENGDAYAEFIPFEGMRYDITIDFASDLIGRQSFIIDLTRERFRRDIARARTFGFMSEVEKLWKLGYALGSSLENSVAIGDDRIINPEGLRWSTEFVRHKTLDAVGDLALAGMPFLGHFRSYKGGHKMNWLVLKALFADHSAYEILRDPLAREQVGGGLAAVAPVFAPMKG